MGCVRARSGRVRAHSVYPSWQPDRAREKQGAGAHRDGKPPPCFPALVSATLGMPWGTLPVRKIIQEEKNRLTERLNSGTPNDA